MKRQKTDLGRQDAYGDLEEYFGQVPETLERSTSYPNYKSYEDYRKFVQTIFLPTDNDDSADEAYIKHNNIETLLLSINDLPGFFTEANHNINNYSTQQKLVFFSCLAKSQVIKENLGKLISIIIERQLVNLIPSELLYTRNLEVRNFMRELYKCLLKQVSSKQTDFLRCFIYVERNLEVMSEVISHINTRALKFNLTTDELKFDLTLKMVVKGFSLVDVATKEYLLDKLNINELTPLLIALTGDLVAENKLKVLCQSADIVSSKILNFTPEEQVKIYAMINAIKVMCGAIENGKVNSNAPIIYEIFEIAANNVGSDSKLWKCDNEFLKRNITQPAVIDDQIRFINWPLKVALCYYRHDIRLWPGKLFDVTHFSSFCALSLNKSIEVDKRSSLSYEFGGLDEHLPKASVNYLTRAANIYLEKVVKKPQGLEPQYLFNNDNIQKLMCYTFKYNYLYKLPNKMRAAHIPVFGAIIGFGQKDSDIISTLTTKLAVKELWEEIFAYVNGLPANITIKLETAERVYRDYMQHISNQIENQARQQSLLLSN